ncbi:VanW family protein [Prauserella sp. PE36]|uniref:VanW family protein n=1 Tax=Prauserella sp. PE36 TaxID=1504709 RepID=UPI001F1CC9F6|nr:VanW family protein [Prauserella sp. PE36]
MSQENSSTEPQPDDETRQEAETTEPTAPGSGESTEPTEPTEPTEAAESAKATEPTELTEAAGPAEAAESAEPTESAVDSGPDRRKLRKAGVIAGAVVGGLALLYGLDLLVTQGDVARGTVVAGVDVGGMSTEDAEQLLRTELEPRLTGPVELAAAGTSHTLDPAAVGLRVDWAATVAEAARQPLNPFTRIASFFSSDDIGVVSEADPRRFDAEVERLRAAVDRDAAEGTVRFEGLTPVAQDPEEGVKLDVAEAGSRILRYWPAEGTLSLPVSTLPVRSTPETVRAALEQIATPAVSGPVTVHGEGRDAVLQPEAIAAALKFTAREDGSLAPRIDRKAVLDAVGAELAPTEQRGRDARFVFAGGSVRIEPSAHGRGIDWDKTLAGLPDVLKQRGERAITATYAAQPAALTTEEAQRLGIKEVIGEFTTEGFAYDSGINIRTVAEKVDGAVVKPGETFSLNGFTGPRGLEQGYVAAGVISNGVPGRAVGGGISQFATTLYNAAYFAGMKDTEHKEHSYYISRYPEGREATVYQNPDGSSVIDLKFTNDSETGVVIQTIWTESDITVRLWGTKRYDVESVTGERFGYTSPPVQVEPIETCSPSSGASGFSVTDTRILRDVATGEVVRREPRTVVYNPQPAIVCEEPEPEPEPEPTPRPSPEPADGGQGESEQPPSTPDATDGVNPEGAQGSTQ